MRGASFRLRATPARDPGARKPGEDVRDIPPRPSTRITSAGCAFLPRACCLDAHGEERDGVTSRALTARAIAFHKTFFHVRYSVRFKNHYCNQMLTPETITSAANPMLKDRAPGGCRD